MGTLGCMSEHGLVSLRVDVLRHAIGAACRSQRELARRTGLGVTTITRAFGGARVSLRTVRVLAAGLWVCPTQIVDASETAVLAQLRKEAREIGQGVQLGRDTEGVLDG